jgi:hypothetical protein
MKGIDQLGLKIVISSFVEPDYSYIVQSLSTRSRALISRSAPFCNFYNFTVSIILQAVLPSTYLTPSSLSYNSLSSSAVIVEAARGQQKGSQCVRVVVVCMYEGYSF